MIENGKLLRKPKNSNLWCLLLLLVVSLVLNKFQQTLNAAVEVVIIFGVLEIVLRLIQILEYNIYQKKSINVLSVFNFNIPTIASFILLYVIILKYNLNVLDGQRFCSIGIAYIFVKVINIEESKYQTCLKLENLNGLDYGSGMAYSFFYGYLHILLPNKGDENQNIRNLMNLYESMNNIKFSFYKLIILIPSSLYCPPNLSDLCNNGKVTMEACKTLESIHRDRAGVKSRKYNNSVYKIDTNDGEYPQYVLAEGATPLLTLHESLIFSGKHQEYYKEYKDEIVLQFYHTLKYLIENNVECKNLCEIIYYNSEEEKNIGELILQRINIIKHVENSEIN